MKITLKRETRWRHGSHISVKVPTGRSEAWHFFPDDSYVMAVGNTPLEAISNLIIEVAKRKDET